MYDDPPHAVSKTWTSGGVSATGDRATRYGDGVFVTLGIRAGVLLDAELQLDRLRRAADRIGLLPPEPFDDPSEAPFALAAILERLGAGSATNGTARLQWSAGPGDRGFARDDQVAGAIVDLGPPPAARRPHVVVLDESEAPLPALPRWKTCSALANVVCERTARGLGADTGVRTRDGLLLETGSANLFWLRDGCLFTPHASLPLYAGTVRTRMLECAENAGLPVDEGEFGLDALWDAEAVVLTNAARGAETAASLDGRELPEPPEVGLALVEAVAARRAAAGLELGTGTGGPDAPA